MMFNEGCLKYAFSICADENELAQPRYATSNAVLTKELIKLSNLKRLVEWRACLMLAPALTASVGSTW
jgi:hypothetical protein